MAIKKHKKKKNNKKERVHQTAFCSDDAPTDD